MEIKPIAPDLFEMEAGRPRLIGARRKADGKVVFPAPQGAEAAHYDRIRLADRGKLWSFTVQRFRPKSPPYAGADDDRSFKPFALGYVELPGEVVVETRIDADDFSKLRIGMPMQLALKPFAKANGEAALTYVFEPEPRA